VSEAIKPKAWLITRICRSFGYLLLLLVLLFGLLLAACEMVRGDLDFVSFVVAKGSHLVIREKYPKEDFSDLEKIRKFMDTQARASDCANYPELCAKAAPPSETRGRSAGGGGGGGASGVLVPTQPYTQPPPGKMGPSLDSIEMNTNRGVKRILDIDISKADNKINKCSAAATEDDGWEGEGEGEDEGEGDEFQQHHHQQQQQRRRRQEPISEEEKKNRMQQCAIKDPLAPATSDNNTLVRLYVPFGSEKKKPALVWFHGGGWVVGSIDADDMMCARMANLTGFVVVSVSYSLAPERPYPAAIGDARTALSWLQTEEASNQGIDKRRIFLAGESAGGTLVAALMAMNHDLTITPANKAVTILGAGLVYPPLDPLPVTKSYKLHAHTTGFLTKTQMSWFWELYLGTSLSSECDDYKACPLATPDFILQRFEHKTIIILAKNDVLYSEGLAYAKRLKKLRVNGGVEVHHYNGSIHGFFGKKPFPNGELAMEKLARKFKALLPSTTSSSSSSSSSSGSSNSKGSGRSKRA